MHLPPIWKAFRADLKSPLNMVPFFTFRPPQFFGALAFVSERFTGLFTGDSVTPAVCVGQVGVILINQ